MHLVEFFSGAINISCVCIICDQYIIDVCMIVLAQAVSRWLPTAAARVQSRV
jgi:hypothetical protein